MLNKQLAKAKINLCLHVTGQNMEGYHLLDSLVAFANYGDELVFHDNEKIEIVSEGKFGKDLSNIKIQKNIIFKTLKSLNLSSGVKIKLQKNLPVSAGIGGGSADAAATLRGIFQQKNIPFPPDDGLALGADVPVCIKSTTQRMQGIGEKLTDVKVFPKLAAVLVNSGDKVSTSVIFKLLKNKVNQDIGNLPNKKMTFTQTVHYLSELRNDLELPAFELIPNIKNVITLLNNSGSSLSRMSGSGATCFGLFADFELAKSAANNISTDNPNWWVQPVILG
ncbi:4-(cytidine 5'-diphospho)-2-C-methyl-D-erythritol kinase [Amylibacter sp.]|nr:4-(cytidine 5'-diphospho)-2-C-methyl-D-erythritol kinase [Amylibacter sp.]